MSNIDALIRSSLSGIRVASNSLQTTSHNISNVNTAGYSRQAATQHSQIGLYSGAGFVGMGAVTDGVVRSYDRFLTGQVWDGTANSYASQSLNGQLQQLNNLMSDQDLGLGTAMNDFFTSAQTVSNNPSGVPERQAMLSNAQILTSRFNTLNDRLQGMDQEINAQLQARIETVNKYSSEIASVNQRIFDLQGQSSGAQPNDLLDQRDHLIEQLSQEIGVSVFKQDNGQLNVFTGNGQALVTGSKAYALQALQNPYDGNRLELGYGPNKAIISEGITGGALGGLLRFRTQNLDEARNLLGRVAAGVAQSMNTLQSQGLDLKGQLGQALFQMPGASVYGHAGNSATGANLNAQILDAQQLSGSDYQIAYDGSNWQVTRLSDRSTVYSGSVVPLNFDGLQVSVASGTPTAGDRYLVQPTRRAAGDIKLISNDPASIAAASPYVSNTGQNAGAAQISTGRFTAAVGDVNLPSSVFGQTLTLNFTSATNFDVTTGSPPSVLASGSYNSAGTTLNVAYPAPGSGYWQVSLSGVAKTGDGFSLSSSGPGDNHNALNMAALQNDKVLGSGSMTLGNAYGQLISKVGNAGQQAAIAEKAQASVLQQVQASQQSLAGVNLDEEAANMMRYQQAYQASAKMIQIADTLFQSILSIKGA